MFKKNHLQGVFTLFLTVFLAFSTKISAQNTVTGTLKDGQTGEVLIGANVVSKEIPTLGTITDLDGRYSLTITSETKSLEFGYAGYTTVLELIAGRSVVDIELTAGKILDDVVIIGYGSVKREDATGSVQSVSSESFNRGAITGPQDLLAGKIAGVVITSDGSPGGGAKIRVRGESSLNASSSPLIVVDGVPLDDSSISGSRNALNIVNPNDIETFTVLKDASAAAIYGNRASGGVILITTKKGKLGNKFRINYNANVSVGQTAKRVDVLSGDEYRDLITNNTFMPDERKAAAVSLLGNQNTDWQNEIFQNAFGQDHNLSLSGGVGIFPIRVSLGYTDKNGLLKTDNFNRLSTGVNINPGFLDNRLQFNLGFKGSVSKNQFADNGAIGSALSFDPTQAVRNSDGLFGGFTTWRLNDPTVPNNLAPANPVALLELKDNKSTVNQYIVNGSVDYRFKAIPKLRANLNLALDYANGEGTTVVPTFASFAFNNIHGGGVNNSYSQTKKNSLLEYYMNYGTTFGKHGVEAMAGYSYQKFFETNAYSNSNAAGTPSETQAPPAASKELVLLAFFSRIQYDFAGKFLLYGTIRADASSRWATGNKWGYFPAAAAAYKMVDNTNPYFNFVKLRVGYGVTGNQNIGSNYYPALGQYELGLGNAGYQFGNQFINTLRPNGFNSNLSWEQTATTNVGVDFSIKKDRIGGTIEVYQRQTSNLLVYSPLPALSGLSNEGFINLGEMSSKGIELSLNFTPVATEKINWSIAFNGAYNISNIEKLTVSPDSTYQGVLVGGISGGVGSRIQINSVGYRPSSFYVYEQLYDEQGKILEGKYKDRNGDGIVNEKDFYRLENPSPLYTLGITNNLRIGKFDFAFAGRANLGSFIYNNVQTDMGYLNRVYGQNGGYLVNVNRSAVDLNVLDQANLTFSDQFIQNGSFFRIDHVTVAYNFKLGGDKDFRVYSTVQNPFVVTPYEGIDPEIGNGIDNQIYPRPRTYLLGVSLSF